MSWVMSSWVGLPLTGAPVADAPLVDQLDVPPAVSPSEVFLALAGAERQDLPDSLTCLREPVDKPECGLAQVADPPGSGQ